MPVSFDTSKMLALDGGRSLAMIASLNSLEYLMAIIVVSPCPYINTQITKIEATSFLTQGALLRHLQEFDGGKVSWIPEGQTAFPLSLRKKLMEAASKIFLDGTFSLLHLSTKNESIYGSDEIAKLKGLILWLAWNCNISLSLESKYAEAPKETEERFQTNGLMILLAQLSGGDDIIIEEARKSIVLTRPSTELNWLNWIVSTGDNLRNLQYPNHGGCVSGESAGPNYLAFHPKITDLGVRLVKRADSSFVDLISFLPENKCRSFKSSVLLVCPLKNVLPCVPF